MNIKTISVAFSCLFSSLSVLANYGLIQDPEGEVNIRAADSLNAKVIQKLSNGKVVNCHVELQTKNFCFALFESKSRAQDGFIHLSRINFFKNYQKWTLLKYSMTEAVYQLGANTINVSTRPALVKRADFKLATTSESSEQLFTHYQNHPFWELMECCRMQSNIYNLRRLK